MKESPTPQSSGYDDGARKAITREMRERYRRAAKKGKGRILEWFCGLTGYPPKRGRTATRQGNQEPPKKICKKFAQNLSGFTEIWDSVGGGEEVPLPLGEGLGGEGPVKNRRPFDRLRAVSKVEPQSPSNDKTGQSSCWTDNAHVERFSRPRQRRVGIPTPSGGRDRAPSGASISSGAKRTPPTPRLSTRR